jgi:hypothetical protein
MKRGAMWNKIGTGSAACARYYDALEELRPGIDAVSAQEELRAVLPAEVLAHAENCEACVEAAEIFWAARVLLSEGIVEENAAAMNPFFTTRVMAAIAEREVETRQLVFEWRRTVSQVASKLALVSAGALIVAGTWAYDVKSHANLSGGGQAKAATSGTEAASYLFDPGTLTPNPEEALFSPAEESE